MNQADSHIRDVQISEQKVIEELQALVRELAPHGPTWLTYIPAVSAAIAAFSAFASVVASIKSQQGARKLAREAREQKLLPMLVFFRRQERVWIVKNIGEGTAAHVTVRNYFDDNQARDEVVLYPIPPGDAVRLDYLNGPAVRLVANYQNVFGEDPHYSICADDNNRIERGVYPHQPLNQFVRGHESQIDQWSVTRLQD